METTHPQTMCEPFDLTEPCGTIITQLVIELLDKVIILE